MTSSVLPNLSLGLISPSPTAGLLSGGLSSMPFGCPVPAATQGSGPINPKGTTVSVPDSNGVPSLFALPSPSTTPGAVSTIANTQPVALGSGYTLQFDPQTMNGIITPALAAASESMIGSLNNGGMMSYSGSDCRVLMEIATPVGGTGTPRLSKQLLELTTLTVSIHRSKAQVPAGGYINPKGVARGRRTIAGTLIMTKFTTDVLFRFLQSGIVQDTSKDTSYSKIDQLPPFNLTLLFCNEQGYASYQRLIGVELVTDGTVYSIQDMLTEQTISYIATDFTTLMPLNFNSFYHPPSVSDPKTNAQKTVASLWPMAKA